MFGVAERIASRMPGPFRFVPGFEFPIGTLAAAIEVRVAASMKVNRFSVTVADDNVCFE